VYRHGQGYLFLKNGFKYVGNFRHGVIYGFGQYFKDDKIITQGFWENGKLVK
jgi:hypothetical protein